MTYGQDLPKKVAANKALQLIIKSLPRGTLKFNKTTILDSVFHVLNSNSEKLIAQVEEECRNTLSLFFEKVGIYEESLINSESEEDQ